MGKLFEISIFELSRESNLRVWNPACIHFALEHTKTLNSRLQIPVQFSRNSQDNDRKFLCNLRNSQNNDLSILTTLGVEGTATETDHYCSMTLWETPCNFHKIIGIIIYPRFLRRLIVDFCLALYGSYDHTRLSQVVVAQSDLRSWWNGILPRFMIRSHFSPECAELPKSEI